MNELPLRKTKQLLNSSYKKKNKKKTIMKTNKLAVSYGTCVKTLMYWSSLSYNTSARQERHECKTRDKNETPVQYEQYECDTSVTRVLHERRVRNECYTNDNTSAIREENVDFDNDTSKHIFSHPYISYMANERLQVEEQFHFGNSLFPSRNAFEKCTTKTGLCNCKSYIKKLYTRL